MSDAEIINAKYRRLSRQSLEAEAVENWEAITDVAEALYHHRIGKIDDKQFVWRVRTIVTEGLGMNLTPPKSR